MSAYSRTPSDLERSYYRHLITAFARRREDLGMTMEQLEARLGLAEGQVNKWESFQRVPGAFMLMCWSNALGLSLFAFHHQLETSPGEGEAAHRRKGETCQVRPMEAGDVPAKGVHQPAPQLQLQLRQNVALRPLLPPVAPPMAGTVSSTPRANISTASGSPPPPRASGTAS